jgi:hypothetical protein
MSSPTKSTFAGLVQEFFTDYRQRLRAAANEGEQNTAIQMIAMKRLAKTCNKNPDTAFAALFPDLSAAALQASSALRPPAGPA